MIHALNRIQIRIGGVSDDGSNINKEILYFVKGFFIIILIIKLYFRMTATGILAEQAMLELGAVDTTELLTLLECPVCLDHITPPVKQCIKVRI